MSGQVYVGMAVTAHNNGALSTAVYSNVEINRSPVTPQLNFDMVIDGQRDAWYKFLSGPDNGYIVIPAAAYNDNGQPDNAADLSASLWTAWDETYLYVYEEVKDNKVNVNNPTSWQNDVLELYFDPDPTKPVTNGQVGITITALDTPDVDQANWSGITNLTGNGGATGNIVSKGDYARAKISGGYAIEARIKWEWLKDATRTLTPEVGKIFGLAVMNHDNDADKREGSISWATVLKDNVWNTPANHGKVEFLPDHQLKLTPVSPRDPSLSNPLAPLYVPTNLPADWLTMNLGTVPAPGNVTESSGTWTVAGSGADIGGTEDAFRFAFQVRSGDIELTAKLESLTKSDPWTKAGLMIRDDLTPNSAHAFICLASDNGEHFQYRTKAGQESQDAAGEPKVKAPRFVKIVRIGDLLQGWTSVDGKAWLKVGQTEIKMTGQIYVGMAVTAHHATKTSTAVFSGVQFKTKPTAVEEKISDRLPDSYELLQNYPNPFNPTTTLSFSLPVDDKVKLAVYDILGREVRVLVDGKLTAGVYRYEFDAADLPSGVYFYRLKTANHTLTNKMMLIK
ncbi:MAG: T9SS type A sorting domain-containing protein, partial [candidate division KSB1 bacterium]|nr:T9SS type A sorting domain-containing protein [candidate division KSB1 bacterium]